MKLLTGCFVGWYISSGRTRRFKPTPLLSSMLSSLRHQRTGGRSVPSAHIGVCSNTEKDIIDRHHYNTNPAPYSHYSMQPAAHNRLT